MSLPRPEDEALTIAQVKHPNPINHEESLTWLRHKLFRESGQIDLFIIAGKYSVEEIAEKLSQNINFTEKTLGQRYGTPSVTDLKGKKIGLIWTVFPNGDVLLDAL